MIPKQNKVDFSRSQTPPKGLKGYFLKIGDMIQPNDLIDYSKFPSVRGGWKRVGNSGIPVARLHYFRPQEAYQVDQTSYYLGSQDNEEIIDIEGVEEIETLPEPEKEKYVYTNISKDDFDGIVDNAIGISK